MTLRSSIRRGIPVGGTPSSPHWVYLVLAGSLLANAYFLVSWEPGTPSDGGALGQSTLAAARQVAGDQAGPAALGEGAGVSSPTPASSLGEPSEADPAPETVEPSEPAKPDIPVSHAFIRIDGPVSRAFVRELGSPLGDRLALTAGRLLVWNLNLSKDPRPGDIVELLFEVDSDDPTSIDIFAVRYHSKKFARTFEAWRFKPDTWRFPSWFDSTGREVPAYLTDGPIVEYEQITSLLGDGRRHSGVDFKAPIGTPVRAPFAGVVTRVNWRPRYNGNCIELQKSDGTTARLLHLDSVLSNVRTGTRLAKGQAMATSGNTGRSSNPHLHFELSSPSGRTLDPLDVHSTEHRLLSPNDRVLFEGRKAELEGWLAQMAPSAPEAAKTR